MRTHHKISFLLVLLSLLVLPKTGTAHCQIPCGIFDDYAKVGELLQDAETIEKSARLIRELNGESDVQSHQQMIRWVMNKEVHAQKVIATMNDYFLTQRVKASQENYKERLVKHHTVIVAAMKTKQSAESAPVEALTAAIKELFAYYPAPPHKH